VGRKLLNGLIFNVAWLLIVRGQSDVLAWAVAAACVAVHLALFGHRGEWRLVALLGGLGLLLDQLLFAAGILVVPGRSGPAPLWLSALWPVFAITLAHLFAGLAARPLLAAAVGAAGGYASYRLGSSLSDVAFGNSPASDLVLVLLWAVLFPALLLLAKRMTGPQEEVRDALAK